MTRDNGSSSGSSSDWIALAWVQVLGTFTMFPLLRRDGLTIPYFVCILLYISIVVVLRDFLGGDCDRDGISSELSSSKSSPDSEAVETKTKKHTSNPAAGRYLSRISNYQIVYICLSSLGAFHLIDIAISSCLCSTYFKLNLGDVFQMYLN